MDYTTISETVDAYDDMLNLSFDPPVLGGIEYVYSEVWNRIDPIAYKCGWLDWCDAEGIDIDELEDDYTFTRDR